MLTALSNQEVSKLPHFCLRIKFSIVNFRGPCFDPSQMRGEMAQNIGYARVPSNDEDLQVQLVALKKAGCKKVFHDVATGCRVEWPGLQKCVLSLNRGDVLHIDRLDRLACSMPELIATISQMYSRGVHLCSLEDINLDTRKKAGQSIGEVFISLARFQMNIGTERTRKGRFSARSRGRMGGRKAVHSTDPKVLLAKRLSTDHSISIHEICSRLRISRASYYRYIGLRQVVER